MVFIFAHNPPYLFHRTARTRTYTRERRPMRRRIRITPRGVREYQIAAHLCPLFSHYVSLLVHRNYKVLLHGNVQQGKRLRGS